MKIIFPKFQNCRFTRSWWNKTLNAQKHEKRSTSTIARKIDRSTKTTLEKHFQFDVWSLSYDISTKRLPTPKYQLRKPRFGQMLVLYVIFHHLRSVNFNWNEKCKACIHTISSQTHKMYQNELVIEQKSFRYVVLDETYALHVQKKAKCSKVPCLHKGHGTSPSFMKIWEHFSRWRFRGLNCM